MSKSAEVIQLEGATLRQQLLTPIATISDYVSEISQSLSNDDMLHNDLGRISDGCKNLRGQVAGDVLFPDDPAATRGIGFLATGPWDESSQMGISDGTIDKKIAQYLDRDDMIATVMSTFVSTTVHCARCHDHKFDPVPTEDYYALQAVFAGVDKIDRPFDNDARLAKRRALLLSRQRALGQGQVPDGMFSEADLTKLEADLKRSQSNWAVLSSAKVESSSRIELASSPPSPESTPPWTAAPYATASSGLTPLFGSLPLKKSFSSCWILGMRVEPPTSTTSSISSLEHFESRSAFSTGAMHLRK